ncbi:hypothetical protein GF339_03095 [candidate division KSB3 bacterium]|uniref:Calcineurin-like phosphoesterase domain-containing protein n=1 Tax=candidate division KSB3 bacterium TaxID=2044937 RepID=A0A9D5JT80_9BACT|nr:hypothetical protein [candidate division KSB3 bacterium]MBD3323542.1 hypothetical protein [candidate division KSB3 bacterium]
MLPLRAIVNQKPRFIISDLHLGDGRQEGLEDFDHHAAENFVNFFREVAALGGVKVILNGDFIDFPQIQLNEKSASPQRFLGTTEAESTARLQHAMAGHPDEFHALEEFLAREGNELLLITGNHDVDLCWDQTLRTLMQRIGATEENFKTGIAYREGGVYVTHGHQYSDDNQIDVPINFTFNRLNSCWGTLFVEHFFNRIEAQYPLLDNARPMWKAALSALLYEDLLVTGQFAAELLMFVKNFRVPLRDYAISALLGWQPKTRSLREKNVENLVAGVQIDALREKLQALRHQPEFRQGFDATLQDLDNTQWDRLLSGVDSHEQDVQDLLLNGESSHPQSRSFFSSTDNYQQAARCIARYQPAIRVVVMGHTHVGIDAKLLQAEGSGRTFLYFNSGTWVPSYTIPWWKLPRLDDLTDSDLYTPNSGVIRCTGADDTLEVKYVSRWQDVLA